LSPLTSAEPSPLEPAGALAAFVVDLEAGGKSTEVHVFDPDHTLIDARPADASEVAAALKLLSASEIVAFRGGCDDTVIVGSLVTPCDQQAAVTVVATSVNVELPPRPGCDALGIGRVVSLQFADPARAALMSPHLVPATSLPER
jgi:hypothetical protein